jgi:hypothetical protein
MNQSKSSILSAEEIKSGVSQVKSNSHIKIELKWEDIKSVWLLIGWDTKYDFCFMAISYRGYYLAQRNFAKSEQTHYDEYMARRAKPTRNNSVLCSINNIKTAEELYARIGRSVVEKLATGNPYELVAMNELKIEDTLREVIAVETKDRPEPFRDRMNFIGDLTGFHSLINY